MSDDQQQHPLGQQQITQGAGVGRSKTSARRARRLARKHAEAMPAAPELDGPVRTRVVDAPLKSPAPDGGILGVIREPYILRLLVRREMAKRYAASLLGLLWSYIQPGMRFLVYYFLIAGVLRVHRDVPYFPVHLFTGIVATHYFAETVGGGTRSLWQNRALLIRTPLPREVFPVASMLTAAMHTFPQLVLLVVTCLLVGWQIDLTGAIAGALGFGILMAFGTALAILLSALNVYYRDIQNMVATILQFMHFMVPMLYPFEKILRLTEGHPIIYQLYLANPAAEGVLLLQRFFWYGVADANGSQAETLSFPDDLLVRGFIMFGVSLLLLWLAQRVFTRLESKFPERL